MKPGNSVGDEEGGSKRHDGGKITYPKQSNQSKLKQRKKYKRNMSIPNQNRRQSNWGSKPIPGTSKEENPKESKTLEIPGFYFDKEKNRYFKITSCQNATTGAMTRENIEEKAREEKRQRDLCKTHFSEIMRKENSCEKSLPRIFMNANYGNITKEQLTTVMIKNKATSIKTALKSQLVFNGSNIQQLRQDSVEHMLQMEVNPSQDKILGLWCLKDSSIHHIQLLDIKENLRSSEKESLSIKVKPCGAFISQSLSKVTHMCWASPELSEENHQNMCLYVTMCPTGYSFSVALIRNFEPQEGQSCAVFDVNLGKKATWSCAWNAHLRQFSVGTEKCSLVIDPETRKMWEYNTYGSDPLSQVFTSQHGYFLFSGTKKGQILTHDMRSSSTKPCSSPLQQDLGVCSLRLLKNDVDLIAADFTGKVCLWDLRMQKVVLEYHGHKNEYKVLPMHVDEHEKLVYGAGQDGYVRFWCLRSGELLNTIPPPVAVSKDNIPAIHFSMRWGNRSGNSGMIMGLQNKLYFYGSIPID
ncbi:hypothetical protein CHS0354_015757 [Potamilus streckersoni]|uniref:Uncharacterized protein n=1 Tax=Potamilus streckersoni TaxID=2493646 RepID=A0AAE0T478_9BIVA|nr:hypothetical protein CHS0354_015757 [Potamilus streckersoni]